MKYTTVRKGNKANCTNLRISIGAGNAIGPRAEDVPGRKASWRGRTTLRLGRSTSSRSSLPLALFAHD